MKINGKKILASGLTLVVAATGFSVGLKLNKKSPYAGSEITNSYGYLEEISIDDSTIISDDVIIDNDELYNLEMYTEKLNDICSSKNFNKDATESLNSIIEKLYNNYGSMYDIYKSYGMPTKDEYISEFLNTIENNINSIKFVDPNENNELTQELDGAKGRFIIGKREILINSLYDNEENIETLFHEIKHSTQDKYYDNYGNLNYGIYQVFVEGEASNTSTLLSNTLQFNNKMYFGSDGVDYFLSGASSSSNALFSKYYNMLFTLTDYDTMQDYKNDLNQQKLIEKIEENYEIDGERLFNCIGECVDENINNYGSEKFVRNMCEIENIYLNCIKSDVSKILSKEDTLNLMNMYRHYKMQYSITCNDENKNLNNEKFGIDDIEKKLLDCATEYQVLPSGIEKEVFDVLMFNVNSNVFGQETSITNIMYCNQGDKIIFIGKNSNESSEYNCNTHTIKECESTKDIYDSSLPIISNSNDKII